MSLVQFRPEAPDAGVAHPVERHLAKVEVASSSLVTRSIRYRGQVVRQESAKLSFASSNLAGTSIVNTHFRYQLRKVGYRVCIFYFISNSSTIMFREWGQNVNTNLQHSIDIKPIEIDISQEM